MQTQALMYHVGPEWDENHIDRFVQMSVYAEEVVDSFLGLFLRPDTFGRIVIVRTPFLRNRKEYRIARGDNCRVLLSRDEAERLKKQIRASCISHGHLSILFVPADSDSFLTELLGTGYYITPEEVSVGAGPTHGACEVSLCESVDILALDIFGKSKSVFTFSHDAQFLFVISLQRRA